MSPTPFQSDHHIHDHRSVKQESLSAITAVNDDNNNNGGHAGMCPPSLKVHRDSHAIKKSTSSSSSSSETVPLLVGSGTKTHQRGPVIIYTHSPKVIHTHPQEFMALVQKLTGMSRSEGVGPTDGESDSSCKKPEIRGTHMLNNNYRSLHSDLEKMIKITNPSNDNNNNHNNSNSNSNDDNESSSVITDENCSSSNTRDGVVGKLNSCVGPPLLNTQPVATSSGHNLFPNLPFYNMAGSSEFLYCGVEQPLYDYMDVNFSYNHTN